MSVDGTRGTDERLLIRPRDIADSQDLEVDAPAPTHLADVSADATAASQRSRPRGFAPFEGLAESLAATLSSEAARGIGFLLMPVFMAIGALLYFSASAETATFALCAGIAACTGVAISGREKPLLQGLSLAIAALLAGMLAADFETKRSETLITGSAVATGVTGRVARIEHREDGRVRLTLDVLETARPTLRYQPPRVRLTARDVPDGLAAGDVVNGYARLMPPSGPVRPGGYDFAFESWFDGIGAIGFFLGDPERAEWNEKGSLIARAAAWVENSRLAIAERVRMRIPGPHGEIAAALIAGVRAGIPEEINEALRRTGLAHILSISGLHMALVALTVMAAVRYGTACVPEIAARHPTKKYGAVLALGACAVYLAISGAAVAAQRSFIMLAVMLLALLADRAALTMRNLAIAALLVIAISPHEVMGPSFQMSFSATAALIGGYAAWAQYQAGRPRRAYRTRGFASTVALRVCFGISALAMTSILAGLATTIYGVYHFHRVSPYSLGANLLAMPIVSFLIMPWAVFAGLLMPFGLDWIPLAVMGKGLAMMTAVAMWFSERSPIDAVGLISSGAVFAFTLALVSATLPTTRLRLVSVPLLMLGLFLVLTRNLPDVLVSEDGRLVAVRVDGHLAVNRSRPNGFTIDNWRMAVAAEEWIPPLNDEEVANQAADRSEVFACGSDACAIRGQDAGLVIYTSERASAAGYCGAASLIILDDATVSSPCQPDSGTAVLTKRDLARRGSAAIIFERSEASVPPVAHVVQAVNEPFRPWHDHRQYSRAARGMPPYQRREPEQDEE